MAFSNCRNLSTVVSKATSSPRLGSSSFSNISSSSILFVPEGSVPSYESAGWNNYFASIEEIETEVLATSLTLDVTTASLAPDETLTLNATLLPADVTETTLSWTSSNETVATVDANGVVTAVADGEAIITVSTTDGTNLSATCVVTVETEEVGGEVTDSENMIYFEDATAYANTTINLPLQMKNSADIAGVEFYLYLPEGVTLEANLSNNNLNANRANETHILSSASKADGSIVVLCMPKIGVEPTPFLGNEGTIINIPLVISDMAEGDYNIEIKNIVLSNELGDKTWEIKSMVSTLSVLATTPGDCNRDNAVNVADIVVLANYILGKTVGTFVEKAADFNNDNAVNVADIVSIANYILRGNKAAAPALTRVAFSTRAVDSNYSFDIAPFVLEVGDSKTVTLDLADATESLAGFQCDLYLPEGISIDKNSKGEYNLSLNEERIEGHSLSSALWPDFVRILCIPDIFNPKSFLGEEGVMVNIPLTADASLESGIYEFSISNVVLSDEYGTVVDDAPTAYKGSIIVGDGGDIEDVKLYGKYTADVLTDFSGALATNDKITSIDLSEAVSVAGEGTLTTGNPNTLIYLAEGATLANGSNVVCGDECANLQLSDCYAFSASGLEAAQASYVRTLNGTLWNALYMPFNIPVSAFGEGYDVAYISKVEESADGLVMLIETITEGSLEANTPYFVRAKDSNNTELTIKVNGTTPCETVEKAVNYTVGTTTLQVIGNYSTMTSTELSGCYAISTQGMWQPAKDGAVLRSFRTYLKMTGAPARAIRIHAVGEATDIESDAVMSAPDNSPLIYDLQGRRVENPTKGIYIVNGEKVLY